MARSTKKTARTKRNCVVAKSGRKKGWKTCTTKPRYTGNFKGQKSGNPYDTSTMNYVRDCGCSKKKKVDRHYRCPPGFATKTVVGRATRGGTRYSGIPVCEGGVKPYLVKTYSRCKPTKGGCSYANPRR